jgi:hypothetical protein
MDRSISARRNDGPDALMLLLGTCRTTKLETKTDVLLLSSCRTVVRVQDKATTAATRTLIVRSFFFKFILIYAACQLGPSVIDTFADAVPK